MDIPNCAYDLSVRIAEAVRYLKEIHSDLPLTDKLLECGIKIGISAREGDFKNTADNIRQVDYILEMAARSGYLSERQSLPIRNKCAELLAAIKESAK